MTQTATINLSLVYDELQKGFDDLKNKTKDLDTAMTQAFQNSSRKLDESSSAMKRQEQLVADLAAAYNRLGNTVDVRMQQNTDAIKDQTRVLSKSLTEIKNAIASQTAAMNKHLDTLNKRMQQLGKSAQQTGKETEEAMGRGDRAIERTRKEVGLLEKGFNYLKWTIQRVFYFGAILKFQQSLANVLTEGKDYEQNIASLTSVTNGNLDQAQGLWGNINNLAREVNFSVNEMVKSSLILNKSGITPTTQLLKSLGAIATATGQSMFTQATALSSAVMGNMRGLRQMGIAGKDLGDSLSLTFNGQTTIIKKNTAALAEYVQKLGESPRYANVLKAVMEDTVTGATKQLSEAWADFSRQIFLSGGDNFLVKFFNDGRKALDEMTAAMQSPAFVEALNAWGTVLGEIWNTLLKIPALIVKGWSSITDEVGVVTAANKAAGVEVESSWTLTARMVMQAWNGVVGFFKAAGKIFGLIAAGVVRTGKWMWDKLLDSAAASVTGLVSLLQALISTSLKNIALSFSGFARFIPGLQDAIDNTTKTLTKPLDDIKKGVEQVKNQFRTGEGDDHFLKLWLDQFVMFKDEFPKIISDEADLYVKKMDDFDKQVKARKEKTLAMLKELQKNTQDMTNFGQGDNGVDFGNVGKGAGGKGRGAAQKQARDTWTAYYQSLLKEQEKTLPKALQIEANHVRELEKLYEVYNANSNVSYEQFLNAKRLIDENYQKQKQELEKQAQEFLDSIFESETAKLTQKYNDQLEKLKEYHDAGLIEEDRYQMALQEVRAKYEDDLSEAEDKKLDKDKKKAQKKAMENFWGGKEGVKSMEAVQGSLNSISTAFSNLTSNMDKNSGAYKALFAVQKSFAFATASIDAVNAWIQALKDPTKVSWQEKLAQYASAVALTTNAIGQLMSISMHDKGGNIPAGQYGIVGEIGPELVRGPASVTSRKDTAELLNRSGDVTVNLIEDRSRAGQVSDRETDEGRIIDICVANIRRGGDLADAVSHTYGLARQGI